MIIEAEAALDMPRAALRMSAATLTSRWTRLHDLRAIRGRRGFDLEAPLAKYGASDGRIVVLGEELDRLELDVAHGRADGGQKQYRLPAHYRGRAAAPVGSARRETGLFTWGAGPGFVGSYDLVCQWSGGRAVARQDVRVVLNRRAAID